MNIFSEKDAKKLASDIKKKTSKVKNTKIVICPPFVYLPALKNINSKNFYLGSQNIATEEKGSLTGEISILHTKEYKVTHSILGHSERRKMGESDEMINKKIKLCLQNKVTPIFCIGENTRDEHGEYLDFIKNQIKTGLAGVSKTIISDVVVAYEPVWAIGAKEPMKTSDIYEMYLFIKKYLREVYGPAGDKVSILYGGSVNKDNSFDIVKNGNVDGLLVGRDSLDASNFAELVKSVI